MTYFNFGFAYNSQGNFPKAIECYEKSMGIAKEAGNRAAEGKTCLNLGLLYGTQGDVPKAIECFENCLKIAREEATGLLKERPTSILGSFITPRAIF